MFNQTHYIYKVGNQILSEWANEWSDILAKFPTAQLLHQNS